MTKVTSAHPLEICLCRDERFSTALPNKLQPEDLEMQGRLSGAITSAVSGQMGLAEFV